jgi:hypothetical protein
MQRDQKESNLKEPSLPTASFIVLRRVAKLVALAAAVAAGAAVVIAFAIGVGFLVRLHISAVFLDVAALAAGLCIAGVQAQCGEA